MSIEEQRERIQKNRDFFLRECESFRDKLVSQIRPLMTDDENNNDPCWNFVYQKKAKDKALENPQLIEHGQGKNRFSCLVIESQQSKRSLISALGTKWYKQGSCQSSSQRAPFAVSLFSLMGTIPGFPSNYYAMRPELVALECSTLRPLKQTPLSTSEDGFVQVPFLNPQKGKKEHYLPPTIKRKELVFAIAFYGMKSKEEGELLAVSNTFKILCRPAKESTKKTTSIPIHNKRSTSDTEQPPTQKFYKKDDYNYAPSPSSSPRSYPSLSREQVSGTSSPEHPPHPPSPLQYTLIHSASPVHTNHARGKQEADYYSSQPASPTLDSYHFSEVYTASFAASSPPSDFQRAVNAFHLNPTNHASKPSFAVSNQASINTPSHASSAFSNKSSHPSMASNNYHYSPVNQFFNNKLSYQYMTSNHSSMTSNHPSMTSNHPSMTCNQQIQDYKSCHLSMAPNNISSVASKNHYDQTSACNNKDYNAIQNHRYQSTTAPHNPSQIAHPNNTMAAQNQAQPKRGSVESMLNSPLSQKTVAPNEETPLHCPKVTRFPQKSPSSSSLMSIPPHFSTFTCAGISKKQFF